MHPIDKKKIELETKDIKDAGVFNGKVRLHVGVVASFKIQVEVDRPDLYACLRPLTAGGAFWLYRKLQIWIRQTLCRTNDIIPMN